MQPNHTGHSFKTLMAAVTKEFLILFVLHPGILCLRQVEVIQTPLPEAEWGQQESTGPYFEPLT